MPNRNGPGAEGVFAKQRRLNRESGPRTARALTMLIVSLLVFMSIWATQTELREVARAEGEISPAGELRRVDHFDGGEVVEILAAVGDEVRRGDVLARIKHPDIEPKIVELETQLSGLDEDIANTKWLLGEVGSHSPSPAAAARLQTFESRQQILAGRIANLERAIEVSERLQANSRRRLVLSEQSLARLESLRQRGVASDAQYILQAEETASVHDDLLQAEASHMRSLIEARDAVAARDEARLAFREEQLAALNELERERRILGVQLDDLRATEARQIIRAPEAGVVQSVGVTTTGEVVPPGALLFELLPSDEQLVAIVKISPSDIGFVSIGSSVSIKPTGLDAKRHGDVEGVITAISPTSIVSDRDPPYFRAEVTLNAQSTVNGRVAKSLRAGMTVQAEILTSSRTVVEYILKPVGRLFEGGLTER